MTEAIPFSDASRLVDLHTHSTFSDGTLSPYTLVAEAASQGLRVLALTDHDTLAGLPEAIRAATDARIELIPGVELSTDAGSFEVHILGYYTDPNDDALNAALADLAAQRVTRIERIVGRLAVLGVPIAMDRVLAIAGSGTVGRPHVARAMIEQGYVQTVSEAFDRFLGSGRPAFVPRARKLPEDSVQLLQTSRAIPVLAHPLSSGDVEGTLRRLVPAGLLGMEVYYGEYSLETRHDLAQIARHWDLIPTGGSDFHGPGFKEGRELGSAQVPLSSAERLRERWEMCR
jgi:predicted metal-dependent phosphoesterase TrpH